MKEDAAAAVVVEGDFSVPAPQLFIAANTSRYYGTQAVFKRALDVLISLGMLIVLSPLMAVIAFLVKRSSPGPVLFVQERLGRDGVPFRFYKFRSMEYDSNDAIHRQFAAMFISGDESGCAETNAGDKVFKLKADPRITRIGAFLRQRSLDELPQFVNVLQGRMSIVGPRPHAVAHNEIYRNLQGRDVRRRTASSDRLRDRQLQAVAHGTSQGGSGSDRSLAGQRPEFRLLRRDGSPGCPVHQQLVDLVGCFHHPAYDSRRSLGNRRLLIAGRGGVRRISLTRFRLPFILAALLPVRVSDPAVVPVRPPAARVGTYLAQTMKVSRKC